MVGRLWVRSLDSVTETAPGCIFRTIGQASSPGVQAEVGHAAASVKRLTADSARPRLRFRYGIAGAFMSRLLRRAGEPRRLQNPRRHEWRQIRGSATKRVGLDRGAFEAM